MATTTNYGWTTPDDTALVKDGAAAIRTLGSSVDTTTKNLNPETTLGDISYRSSTANVNTRLPLGTAGQVLKVNSGATAPEWATDSSGMSNPMTTTGDTIYSSSGSTPARLGIGSTGNVLTVAGGVPTWAAPSSGALTLIAAPTSFSASSAVNVNDVFSATYENYLILLNLDSASVDDYTNFRVRVGGSDETSSIYNWSLMANGAGNSAFDGGAGASQSSYRLSYIAGTGQGASMVINVNRPFLTKATNLNVSSVANFSTSSTLQLKSGGSVGNTTSYTSFTIFPASGNITGKVAVYGYSI